MNKRGLGRGLGALLSSTPTVEDVLIERAVVAILAIFSDGSRASFVEHARQ